MIESVWAVLYTEVFFFLLLLFFQIFIFFLRTVIELSPLLILVKHVLNHYSQCMNLSKDCQRQKRTHTYRPLFPIPSLPLSLLSFVVPSAPKGKLDAIEHNRCLGSRVSSLKALSGQMKFPLSLAEETEIVFRGLIVFQQLGERCREEK